MPIIDPSSPQREYPILESIEFQIKRRYKKSPVMGPKGGPNTRCPIIISMQE
jgi:hypothetical protein